MACTFQWYPACTSWSTVVEPIISNHTVVSSIDTMFFGSIFFVLIIHVVNVAKFTSFSLKCFVSFWATVVHFLTEKSLCFHIPSSIHDIVSPNPYYLPSVSKDSPQFFANLLPPSISQSGPLTVFFSKTQLYFSSICSPALDQPKNILSLCLLNFLRRIWQLIFEISYRTVFSLSP